MKGFYQEMDELNQFLDFMEEDIGNVRRAIQFCEDKDIETEFMVHAKSETAKESAENIGIDEEKIVKTLVFSTENGFVAVLCRGDSRVSESKLEEKTDETVEMASPSEVKRKTGYTVGGVSPFDLDIPVFIEKELLENEKVRPAAGSRVVGVELDPKELKSSIDAEAVSITED